MLRRIAAGAAHAKHERSAGDYMKGWTRFFCVLIALYNLRIGWITEIRLGLGFCKNLTQDNATIETLSMLVLAALLMYLLVHSIRLIMLFEGNRKIQLFLSGSMPFARVISVFLILHHQNKPISGLLLFLLLIGVFIDLLSLGVILLPGVRRVFSNAEKERQDKWVAKKSRLEVE